MYSLQLSSAMHGAFTVVGLQGELRPETTLDLHRVLAKALHGPAPHVIVDLGEVGYVGSAVLGMFVKVHQSAARKEGSFALARLPPQACRALSVTGLSGVLLVYPTVQEAMATEPLPLAPPLPHTDGHDHERSPS
jgi:anti-anti-sigma factor